MTRIKIVILMIWGNAYDNTKNDDGNDKHGNEKNIE